MARFSWIIWGGPKSYHKSPDKREAKGNVRVEDAKLLALKMEEEAKSQEMGL